AAACLMVAGSIYYASYLLQHSTLFVYLILSVPTVLKLTSDSKEPLMSTKKKTTDEVYDDNSEASRAKGVRPKGSRPPPQGKVTVVHKRKGLGLAIMDKAQLGYIATAGVVGMYEIYGSI